jgi:hypothetical protein
MNMENDFTKSSLGTPLAEDKFPKRDNEPNPAREMAEQNTAYDEPEQEIEQAQPSEAALFVAARARKAYTESTTYMDNSLRRSWDDNLRMVKNEHPSGSKYYHQSYAGRSKLFRPKVRSAMRSHEAAVAAALFSNSDDLVISAQNQSDPMAQTEARIVQKLVQFRMDNTVPWFMTVLGAWQDTEVYGICVTRQEWQYEERKQTEYEIAFDPETGKPLQDDQGNILGREISSSVKVKDRPWVHHISPDHFRFDVNADWRDIVGSSSFLIEMIPMAAADVLDMMDKADPKTGKPTWYPYTLAQVLAAGKVDNASNDSATELARAGRERQNPKDTFSGDEFSTVYVHLNTIRVDGEDLVMWTLGDSLPLTEPLPIKEVFAHGRPYKIGMSNIESHRSYPTSAVSMGASLQEAINEVTNQRRDNVALALNKRYFIKRQKQGSIDLKALMRSVPGGGVMVDDPDDVRVIETNDVTASSYQEQDRLSVEFDELLGNFSQGSVMGNRKLNETVGGMSLMSSGATAVQDLGIRVFIETWVEPVLKDIARLEQLYETDEVLIELAGTQANLDMSQLREGELQNLLTEADLSVKVNVGMGNTNPTQRIEKLSMALNTAAQFPGILARLNEAEIAKEIMSFVGYAEGARFLIPAEEVQTQGDPQADVKMRELELKEQQMQIDREQFDARLQLDREVKMMELALREQISIAEMQTRLELGAQKDMTVRDATAIREANKAKDALLKFEAKTGVK